MFLSVPQFLLENINSQQVIYGRRRGGGAWVKQVLGMKEGTWDEHWVWCVGDELLSSTPETTIALQLTAGIEIKTWGRKTEVM